MKFDRSEWTLGPKCSPHCILLCLLEIYSFLLPITGFTLRDCRLTEGSRVVCASNKLRTVPDDIPAIARNLDLSDNWISKIQRLDFVNLTFLTNLDLKHNKIAQIEAWAFIHLSQLQRLNLNNNHLTKLEDSLFVGLTNLVELRLVHNLVETVEGSCFKALGSLKVLDLASNKLGSVASVGLIMQHLPGLRELRIRDNKLLSFHSQEMSNISLSLTSLDISYNPVHIFRLNTDIFPNLTRLSLAYMGNHGKVMWKVVNGSWPRQVSGLDVSGLRLSAGDTRLLLNGVNASLSHLWINEMSSNPGAFLQAACTIPSMSVVQFRQNHLKHLTPDVLQLCVHVTDLDLSNNLLVNISSDAFRALRQLKVLTLKGNHLPSVPAATRTVPTLLELDLSSNNISCLSCHDFTNLPKLRELILAQNSIQALSDCLFKDLAHLQVLKLQSNYISKLNGAFKHYLPKLQALRLNNNKLSTITYGEFASLTSLQNLSLHDNQIKTLKNGAFAGLSSLTSLLLQSNEIETSQIRSDVFSGLANLRQLDLSLNHIKYRSDEALPEPPFSRLSRLETLLIPGQRRRLKAQLPRNILEGLSNLLVFSVRNTQLLSVHVSTFNHTRQLRTLDLSSNELRDCSPDLFLPLENLESLYLSRSNLRSLDFLIDAGLTRLEYLQAKSNMFSVISEDVMRSLLSLAYLDLQGNSFTCNCDNAWFLQWVVSNNRTQVNNAYKFECNYPSDLKGRKLLELDVRSCSVDMAFILFSVTTSSTLLFICLSFGHHFLRWQLVYAYYLFLALLTDKRKRKKPTQDLYDAFISYNVHDEKWVVDQLLPKLEGEQGWKLCLHHRDFQPGKAIIENITDAIYASRKTICVISRHYLDSEWCSREIQMASFRLFDERKDVLILVFLDELPASLLSPLHRIRRLMRKQSYLSWPRFGLHPEVFWEKLRLALTCQEERQDNMALLTMEDRP